MPTHDANGRAYAKLSQLKVGDKVQVDDGFTCLKPNSIKTVRVANGQGLHICCKAGHHMLEGQLDEDDNDTLIGIYPFP